MELVKPKKIFIVEEDSLFASNLKSSLIDKGSHEVHVFVNCADCLSAMTEKPEIIILDNHLNTIQKDKASDMHLLDIVRRDFPDVHIIVLAKDEGYGTAMQTITVALAQAFSIALAIFASNRDNHAHTYNRNFVRTLADSFAELPGCESRARFGLRNEGARLL